jgi:hypothetical protein
MGKTVIVDEALLSGLLRQPEMHRIIPGLAAIAKSSETRTCCGGIRRVRSFQDLGKLKRALASASPATLDKVKKYLAADKLIFYAPGPGGIHKVER